MPANRQDIELIRAYEQRLLEPETRRSREEMLKYLADDFYEVGTSGRLFDLDSILETMSTETERKLVMTEFIATAVAEDVILTTFRIIRYVKDLETASSRHSSVWKKRGNLWQMIYHQGTMEPKDGSQFDIKR